MNQVINKLVVRWQTALDTIATASFVAIAVAVTWASFVSPRQGYATGTGPKQKAARAEPQLPTTPLSLEGAAMDGDRNARVAMIVYSDFQCPYCAKFARDVLPALQQEYVRSGKVKVAFRHFPLSIHPLAQKAAEAAECAGRQGRFWEMHDAIFREPKRLTLTDLRARAVDLKLDVNTFDRCLSGEMSGKVLAEAETGRTIVVRGTPTFLLGPIQHDGRVKVTNRLSGAQPLSTFETALTALLKTTN